MKTVYLGPIRDQLYSNKILFAGKRTRDGDSPTNMAHGSREFKGIRASAEGIDWMGTGFSLPFRVSGNNGTGARAEGGFLPAAGSQGYLKMSDNLRNFYGRVEFTGQVMNFSQSSKGAYIRTAVSEMKGVTDDLKRRINIDAYTARDANGTSPVATITATTNSATQPVSTTLYFRIGDTYDICDATGAPTYRNAVARTVVAINPSAKTVTFDATVSTTNADIIVDCSSDSAAALRNNSWGQSMNGLANIVSDTGALHGLNPATAGQGFWKSYVHDNSSAAISDTVLRRGLDEIGMASGMDDQVVGIWNRGIRNAYVNSLVALKSFTDDKATTLRGGFKAILFDDRPFVVDDFCPTKKVYLLNTEDLAWAEASELDWLDRDGSVLSRVPNKDAYEATLYTYINLYTTRRSSHAVITNVADAMDR